MELPKGELRQFQSAQREQCGIVIAVGEKITRIVEVTNYAPHDDNYAISMDDLHRVSSSLQGRERVVGFLHTHLPDDTEFPSDTDFQGAEIFPDYLNFVYHPASGRYSEYRGLTRGNPMNVGRQA